MSEWREVNLDEVVKFQRGHDLTVANIDEGNFPVAGSNGVIGYHNQFTTEAPGITLGRSGNSIGVAHYYDQKFWAHNTTLYAKSFISSWPKYVFYFLRTIDFSVLNSGSAVPSLNRNHIHSIRVKVPDLPEQKAIAAVLSSLDDKIDLLHRQNKTLEAMAETVFRQWFVEEAQEDWEEVALEDVTSRITDGAHVSPPTVEVGLPMASVKDMYQWGINTESCRQISKDDFDELIRTDCRPLKNDILIAKDGSYLKHVFVAEDDMDVVILSSIAILRPNGKYHPLLLATFLKLESTREGLANIVTGAVIPRIVLKDFRKYKLLLPPKQLQDQALTSIQPIYEKCWENDRQIRTLEKLRDNLLPKLMSGEVRVRYPDLDAALALLSRKDGQPPQAGDEVL